MCSYENVSLHDMNETKRKWYTKETQEVLSSNASRSYPSYPWWSPIVHYWFCNFWSSPQHVTNRFQLYTLMSRTNIEIINEWCVRPRFCIVRLYWVDGQPGLMRWILTWIMPWCRIDRLTCWPAVQRTTTVPWTPTLERSRNCLFTQCQVSTKRIGLYTRHTITVLLQNIHKIVVTCWEINITLKQSHLIDTISYFLCWKICWWDNDVSK